MTARVTVLILIVLASVVAMLFISPIAQDPTYHFFADTRPRLGIDNFWNVVSNLPFLVVGALGLARVRRLDVAESRAAYTVMCVALALVGFGSAWYHHAPSNATLLWDRLPMTVAFMALLAMLLAERVITRNKHAALWLLVALGIGAAVYWAWTESRGAGDLRPYILVQFVPVILMPVMIGLFRSNYLDNGLLLAAFTLYVLAKGLEHFDAQALELTGIWSGHSLKHVAAALAALCLVRAVPVRRVARSRIH